MAGPVLVAPPAADSPSLLFLLASYSKKRSPRKKKSAAATQTTGGSTRRSLGLRRSAKSQEPPLPCQKKHPSRPPPAPLLAPKSLCTQLKGTFERTRWSICLETRHRMGHRHGPFLASRRDPACPPIPTVRELLHVRWGTKQCNVMSRDINSAHRQKNQTSSLAE